MTASTVLMPAERPLPMPAQDFAAVFTDTRAPGAPELHSQGWSRFAAFSPALAATGGLVWIMTGWFGGDGLSWVEGTLLTLIAFNFFWICFSVSTVVLGLWSLARHRPPRRGRAQPLNVALLVPVHNEDPCYVMGNAQSMLEELRARGGQHRYSMFILSDTRDDAVAARELASVTALRAQLSPGLRLYYRRRTENTDRKVGNIADWITRWGEGYDAMLVLDADSLMTGRAISRLADALAADPGAGLIQSFPQLIGAQSVFARMQQFANGVYGVALAEGLARWSGQDGNYWGHNAIIRTAAFAQCAGLPRLRSRLRRRDQLPSACVCCRPLHLLAPAPVSTRASCQGEVKFTTPCRSCSQPRFLRSCVPSRWLCALPPPRRRGRIRSRLPPPFHKTCTCPRFTRAWSGGV